MPNDGGNLILSNNEFLTLKNKYSDIEKFIKFLMGSREFINDIKDFVFGLMT